MRQAMPVGARSSGALQQRQTKGAAMTYRIDYSPPQALSLRQSLENIRALAAREGDVETAASLTLWLVHLEQGQ